MDDTTNFNTGSNGVNNNTENTNQGFTNTEGAPNVNGGVNSNVNGAYNNAYGNNGQAGYSQNTGAYGNSNGSYSSNPYNNGYGNSRGQQYNNNQYGNFGTPQQPKKMNNSGKKIFALLIIICILISSVAIGFSVKNSNNSTKEPTKATEDGKTNNGSADANTEDSPISFSEYSGEGSMTPEQVYDAVKDINVGIEVYSQNQKAGEGSGIIVGADKDNKYTYIITAAHVISGTGVTVEVLLNDETELQAEIVGYDTKTDVGVLKVEKTGLPAAKFGNSDKLSVGQKVYAIGNPGGSEFFGSFTSGIVSAIDRPVASTSSAYDLPCIQHNAAINPGNSGGALVNEYGQVIGLNSSKIASTEYEGMGFSVPSNTVVAIYKDIVKNGYVSDRPMLGISYYTVSSDYTYSAIAWKNNLPYGSIVVASITDDSDLKNAGIQVGDIITGVNGKDLQTTDQLLEAIENSKVGDELTLSVCRLNNGTVKSKFDAKVKLIQDKGQNNITEQETTTDPFSSYFGGGFGY